MKIEGRLGSPDTAKTFSRRAFILGAMQGMLLGVLGGRLAWLQIAEGDIYKTLSEKNRINIRVISPSRGQIVDRSGTPMATNDQNFRAMVIPEQTDNIRQSLRALQKFIAVEEKEIQKILKQSKKMPQFVPLQIKDNLTWDEVATVEVNLPDLPGLAVGTGEVRSYPLGEAAAHIIGYVGAVSESEMSDDPLLSLPGFKTGKSGIEKKHDFAMRGKAGTAEVEVNVVGREIRELKVNPTMPGKRVMLTIDAGLQDFVQKALAREKSASAVVMDVHTGAVYALASQPAFDPNMFARGISQPLWMQLSEDPALPLINKAVAGQYPPGSTFKMVTALAGLKLKKTSRDRKVFCPGHFSLGSSVFHCWKPEGHGWVDLEHALQQSCDVYFYNIGQDTGIDAIAQTSRLLGLGKAFGFDLEEERPGLVPDRFWKQTNIGKSWQLGETIITAIGQGFLKTTPLQLATMTARLVNGGYAVQPWLTAYIGATPGGKKSWPKMNVDNKHLELIRSGMNMVVNDPHGTAYGSRIMQEGTMMGGKTGTAQVRRITKQMRSQGVKNEDLAWNHRHHALFVGYAPVDNPKYTCSVVVEHGVGGAKAAAPIARDILMEAQKRNSARQEPQPESKGPQRFSDPKE